MKLLIIRAQPAADRGAAMVRSAGQIPLVMPLFEIIAADWTAPDPDQFDGLFLTSANAVRCAGSGLSSLADLPVFAVGGRTADEAGKYGLSVRLQGKAGKADILARAEAAGCGRLLWLSGRHSAGEAPDEGIIARRIIVYENSKLPPPPDFEKHVANADAVMLHSPRSAHYFRAMAEESGVALNTISVVAISAEVAAAAGDGWREIAIAANPSDADLLLAAQSLAR